MKLYECLTCSGPSSPTKMQDIYLFRETCEKVRMLTFPSTVTGNSNKTITGHLLINLSGCSGLLLASVPLLKLKVQTHGVLEETGGQEAWL